ncbi:MAG TPA: lipoyl(octanoyl) transferase LipB [Planctomycetota bacterium]|nr:lipoyl(octanoyl) transferase LipB [Planctomycetota bacterium]
MKSAGVPVPIGDDRPACRWRALGTVPYGEALALQKDLVRRRVAGEVPDTLLLLEHPHVVTLGKTARREHLLSIRPGVEVVQTDRGGDVTYHGPGQIVGYPIVDLSRWRRDVKEYLERLEEVLIRTVARWGIAAGRREGMTGAWVGDRKIAAIGVRVERWVTSHGFALNVSTDLSYFEQIIPCGLVGGGVTSIAREAGRPVVPGEVLPALVEEFGLAFGRRMEHEPESL